VQEVGGDAGRVRGQRSRRDNRETVAAAAATLHDGSWGGAVVRAWLVAGRLDTLSDKE